MSKTWTVLSQYHWIQVAEFRYINIGKAPVCMLCFDPVANFWELGVETVGLRYEPIEPAYFVAVLDSIEFTDFYSAPAYHGNQDNYDKNVKRQPRG